MVKDINIKDYSYPLPEERIAKFPLENRDDSKLLLFIDDNTQTREPKEAKFVDIAKYLPDNAMMVFNNTKVVPARLLFQRDTGAIIEVFCLEPHDPVDYMIAFGQTSKCQWKAIIGNVKRWKGGKLHLYVDESTEKSTIISSLTVELVQRIDNAAIVEFNWEGGYSFTEVIEHAGRIPIPPYLKRETEAIDYQRYQTYYAKYEGSVAAPTAGLHFTQKEFDDIAAKGIERKNVCLHVGAGTFLPVKSESIGDHVMHSETFTVSDKFLRFLIGKGRRPLISVGTTSTRTLESLYFIGVHCIERGEPGYVDQWEPYREEGYSYSLEESIGAILSYLERNELNHLTSRTRIIIAPGYKFRVIDYLVTNFHQPQSTLLLLIAALVGDNWRKIYQFALDNNFRFLSYGDSSLLQKINFR